MNERGQYGRSNRYAMQPRFGVEVKQSKQPSWQQPSWARAEQPHWTEAQSRSFTRALGASALGSVAGAVLWKDHRIWGFILGGMAGGAVGDLLFAPPAGLP